MRNQVTHCVKCGSELQPEGRGRGRPSRFCSEGCKTSVEAEMRRLNANLKAMELRRAGLIYGPNAEASRRECSGRITEMQARYDRLAGVPQRNEGA